MWMMRLSRGGKVQCVAEGKQIAKLKYVIKYINISKLGKSKQEHKTELINMLSLAPAVYPLEVSLKLSRFLYITALISHSRS